jgi:hypothetical protein
MYAKRFARPGLAVIITALPACDNVSFGGIQLELHAPDVAEDTAAFGAFVPVQVGEEEPTLEPVDLGDMIYVVERGEGSSATILPVARLGEDGYEAVPDPEEIPNLIERFALGRWEAGFALPLVAHGRRVGTFVSDGTTVEDNSTCRIRPRGSGHVELAPEAAVLDRLLATEPTSALVREPWAPPLRFEEDEELRAGSLNIAQRLIPTLGVLWPPSIPEARRDLQPFSPTPGDASGFAASYVYGDRLAVGGTNPRSYSLFVLASAGESRYEPLMTWVQHAPDGKAYPRFVGAHALRDSIASDVVLEVFGETDRWFTVLGVEGEEWSVLYLDECGQSPARSGIRTFEPPGTNN